MIDVKYNGSESRVYPPLATFPIAAVVNKVGLGNLQTQPNGRTPHFNTNRTSIIININRSHYLRNKRAEKVGADFIDDCGSIPTAPENITVTFLTPTSVRVSWQTSMDPHTMPVDKYDVTYKPTDAR
uniref:Fibronectin type-III domain-containing protein n=1 Tax=Anopheles melas TaxID=34690 RepID=A0A182UF08_9DIPT